jgi:hypothetical protein
MVLMLDLRGRKQQEAGEKLYIEALYNLYALLRWAEHTARTEEMRN